MKVINRVHLDSAGLHQWILFTEGLLSTYDVLMYIINLLEVHIIHSTSQIQ